jgi:adenine-specific DNA-methyltransferase
MNGQHDRVRNRARLQSLLRELFQFDSADLDFGIYRIMNQKRAEVERFIERDLLDAVEQGLAYLQVGDRAGLEAQLADKRAQLGDAALDETGAVRAEFQALPIARDYMALYRQVQSFQVAAETEARIFSDLYTFFSRYYDNGDFLTERRYGAGSRFYVPYNGEEVLLHWANRDQYYVKTSERFTDYCFHAGEYTTWFRLARAEVPQDNVKGDRRYFVLSGEAPPAYDPGARTLTLTFEHRPLTVDEEARLLGLYNARQPRSGQRRTLDRPVLCAALEVEILDALDHADLKAHLAAVPEGKVLSCMGGHLNTYTARNTMDYFIHKDLGGFLRRELDFYLKNEVLRLDDLIGVEGNAAQAAEPVQHALARARVVRQIAQKVAAFLAQIEDFQKRLFEKVKFVVQTDYCLTLDRVPEAFYPEILANRAQLDAWRGLYNVDAWERDLFWHGEFDEAFLQHHPYLMIDTAFFDGGFKGRLLATFDDLDAAIDGLLIHGENFQALSLLMAKYRGQVKCIHIDPPYNTQTSGFLYKNSYQHSSWLAMMDNRISASIPMVSPDGSYLCHIDENEYERLYLLFENNNVPHQETIVWDKKNPMLGRRGVATQHEYVLWGAWDDSPIYLRPANIRRILSKARTLIRQHGGVDDDVRQEFATWIGRCEGLSGGERAYRLIDHEGRVFQSVAMGAPEPRQDPKFHIPLIHPVTKKECPVPSNGWSRSPETLQALIEEDGILFGEDETVQPRRKVYLTAESRRQLSSVVSDSKRGKADVSKLGLEFPYCHPVSLYEELLGAGAPGGNDMILDFFAGSGTTAHATMNLNREDDGNRKYVLVEVDDCFDTILRPRIQKVVFSANWKDGVPQDRDGISHMFKYQRIESYEDALNNIQVRPPEGEQLRLLYDEFDDYLLSYMLDFETRESPSLLAQEAFEKPFQYRLKIRRGSESPQETVVDLVETFHYLIGVHVRRLERCEHQGRTYVVSRGEVRTESGIEKVMTVWRDTAGLDLEREADWANAELLDGPVDRVYVNGPSHIAGAEPLEIPFRERMDRGHYGR